MAIDIVLANPGAEVESIEGEAHFLEMTYGCFELNFYEFAAP